MDRILGLTRATVYNYRANDGQTYARSVHPTVAQVMRCLATGWRPPEWAERDLPHKR